MALRDIFIRTKNTISSTKYAPSLFLSDDIENKMKESGHGKVPIVEVKFPKDLGEQHPFDYTITEGLYKEFGPVTGIIDKFIDFVVGPGFFVESEDERAKQIIEDFMRDINFDTLLRAWLKEALVKGIGYLELGGKKDEAPQGIKVLNPNHMYIQRDDFGVIKHYNQFIGKMGQFTDEKVMKFEPFQIAHLSLNKIGDSEYGMGVIYPAVTFINRLIGNQKEMQTLLRRKANSPIHVKIGGKDGKNMPTPEDVDAFGQKLEWMNNKHEWATDSLVEMKVLDFGDIGDKFSFFLEHDLDMIFFTVQVPEVLMGRSVNLAVAPVQMDAFERRTQSMQSEMEKVIEQDIFKRVLNANGLDAHVEFQWGQPSNTEKKERLVIINNFLKVDNISFKFISMLEMEAAKLLGFNVKELESEQEEREREEGRQQPIVPGQNQQNVELGVTETIYEGEIISKKNDY